MLETGVVVEQGEVALIKIDRKSECATCGACGMKDGMKEVALECENVIDAKKGDLVAVNIAEKNKMASIILVFLVPLILLAIGIGVGIYLKIAEIWLLVVCLGILVSWYTILAFIDKIFAKSKKFMPKIVKILQEGVNND